jgi:hypothetical protein
MVYLETEINKLYIKILKRPADSSGLNHYTSMITTQNWSLNDVNNALNNSDEKRTLDIKKLYKDFLHREADPEGLSFYLNSDFSIEKISNLLLNSEEKKNKMSFIESYKKYFDNFPMKLSKSDYDNSLQTLESINNFYISSFSRELDNALKFYYQLLFFNNNKFIKNDLLNYKVRVEEGKKIMKEHKLVICGLLRDKSTILNSLKHRCYELVQYFSDYRILIVENDSEDDTREKLLEWSYEDTHVLILGNGINAQSCKMNFDKTPNSKPADSSRIQKMSFLRNIYLDCLRDNFNNFDYVVVLDMDLDGDLFMDGVCESFYYTKNKNVDGIACNGLEKYNYHYYDSFAYVEINKPYIWDTEQEKTDHDNYIFHTKTKQHTQSMKVTRVLSAFGGFCIYRLSSIIHLHYNYSPGKFSCEHSHLNVNLNHFFINPRMVFAITDNS